MFFPLQTKRNHQEKRNAEMALSPLVYHRLVRPKWMTQKYIHNHINANFDLKNKRILDFGAGTGANCTLCTPEMYHGIEPDHGRVQLASRLYPGYKFSVLQEDVLPVEDQSIDFVMIIAVLHHIATQEITRYVAEFRRILSPEGRVLVIEPSLWEHTPICNRFMQWLDKGEYIRDERGYLELFEDQGFTCQVLKRFKKGLFYNEVYFYAVPEQEKGDH